MEAKVSVDYLKWFDYGRMSASCLRGRDLNLGQNVGKEIYSGRLISHVLR